MNNLTLEQPLDAHLKPVKDIHLVNSAMEISTTKVRIQDLEVTGTTTGISASVDVDSSLTDGSTNPVENNAVYDALATKLNLSGGDITGDSSISGNFEISDGNLQMDGNNITTVGSIEFDDTQGATINGMLDSDTMSGTSATRVSSSESIKAYVDAVPLSSAYSKTIIKVMPMEFIHNDDRGHNVVEDDTTDTLGLRAGHVVQELYAFVKIPDGYTATHVQVYASASTSSAVEAYSYNYQTGATASKGSGDFNASIDITDVASGATSDLAIKILPASTSTIIYGALVTIAST